jgi:HD-GYP domain-containing protein (c-di-GMP phosphodiesterase class II)
MTLALPLHHPSSEALLLAEGFKLDRQTVARLRGINVPAVWVHFPGAELIRQHISPVLLHHQHKLVGVAAELFEQRHREAFAQLDYTRYIHALRDLIEALVADPAAANYIVEMGGAWDDDLRHASEVSFLSLLMGLKLEGYLIEQRRRLKPLHARSVVGLGLGGLLHDIGMTQIDPETRSTHAVINDANDRRWQLHVERGWKLVRGLSAPVAVGIVLHHHQHFDGSGFPKHLDESGRAVGLKGEEIHVHARIVCAADHFDRLRCEPSGRLQPRVRVLRQMLFGPCRGRFDPVVLRALTQIVPAYSPGSMVTLSIGRDAIVTNWHPDDPCRPVIRVMRGRVDQPESIELSEPIDLREQPAVHIVGCDGHDVTQDNFALSCELRGPDRSDAAAA